MFELKKGMHIALKNKCLILNADLIEKQSFDSSTSFYYSKDIDWEETAKLNGIDLEEEKINAKLNEENLKIYYSKTIEREDTQMLNLKKIEIKKLNEKVKIAKENMNKEYAHKHDKGKLQWNLLPINEVEEIVKVLDYGLQKYGKRDCWQLVENPKLRYENSLYRHFAEYLKGNKIDEESGLSHLSHLVTNGLFLMWFENNKEE